MGGQAGQAGHSEEARVAALLSAEARALELVDEVTRRGLLAPGVGEVAASDAIRDLAAELYGVRRHWHKRIVRAGPHTLEPYRANPPDRLLSADDIVFLDLGPIFAGWEADVGRTFVLGDDPVKLRLRDDLPVIWAAGRAHFEAHPDVTGAELYAHVVGLAEAAGWEFGGAIAGHLIGEFPHERLDGSKLQSYVAPGCTTQMRRLDPSGRPAHWILEVHLVDRARGIGGFHEQLLDLRVAA